MPDSAVALGFDYGKRRVGVAVGNTIAASARPLTTLEHRDGVPDWYTLDAMIGEWRPGALIVGLPLNVDGATQKMTNRARSFAQALRGRYDLTVHTVDERYSTIEAGKRLAKGDIDAMAAQTILESWLLGYLEGAT